MITITQREADPITAEVVGNALQSIAEEMGVALVRSAYSTNIKERRDCSCAVFRSDGSLISLAEQIPVHLGWSHILQPKCNHTGDKGHHAAGQSYIGQELYAGPPAGI